MNKFKITITNEDGEVWEQFLIRREKTDAELPEAEEARRVRDYIECRYETV
jgi:hypothetical protein